ncbi:hypothetical protein [Lysinibacillus sphaericus]|uniref:hypothetical protein n=1 Tax=Lysinibacillus sphaericus TaxID=1421 RepID=UPI000565CEFA|nr:hypothetical protein [Lysinibacillus sphaericus]
MNNPYFKQNIRKQFRFDLATIAVLEAVSEKKGYSHSDCVRDAISSLASTVLTQEEIDAAVMKAVESKMKSIKETD